MKDCTRSAHTHPLHSIGNSDPEPSSPTGTTVVFCRLHRMALRQCSSQSMYISGQLTRYGLPLSDAEWSGAAQEDVQVDGAPGFFTWSSCFLGEDESLLAFNVPSNLPLDETSLLLRLHLECTPGFACDAMSEPRCIGAATTDDDDDGVVATALIRLSDVGDNAVRKISWVPVAAAPSCDSTKPTARPTDSISVGIFLHGRCIFRPSWPVVQRCKTFR